MRPGRMREAAKARELAEEGRQAAREHGRQLSPHEEDELARDLESLGKDRQFVL